MIKRLRARRRKGFGYRQTVYQLDTLSGAGDQIDKLQDLTREGLPLRDDRPNRAGQGSSKSRQSSNGRAYHQLAVLIALHGENLIADFRILGSQAAHQRFMRHLGSMTGFSCRELQNQIAVVAGTQPVRKRVVELLLALSVMLRIKTALLDKQVCRHLHHQIHKTLTTDSRNLNGGLGLQYARFQLEAGHQSLMQLQVEINHLRRLCLRCGSRRRRIHDTNNGERRLLG